MKTRTGIVVLAEVAVLAVIAVAVGTQWLPGRGAAAAPVTSSQTVTAQGHGEVVVTPDQASITLGVQTRAKDARSALSTNTTKTNSVIAALKRQGVATQRIQTTDMSLWFDTQANVYQVTHNLSVRLEMVKKLGAVLDAAVGSGANSSWGVSFGLKDPSAAQAKALKAAVAAGERRAQTLAAALGSKMTGTTKVDETNVGYTPKAGGMGGGGGGGTTAYPGQFVVTADVVITCTTG